VRSLAEVFSTEVFGAATFELATRGFVEELLPPLDRFVEPDFPV
jgi:hypothetical protein